MKLHQSGLERTQLQVPLHVHPNRDAVRLAAVVYVHGNEVIGGVATRRRTCSPNLRRVDLVKVAEAEEEGNILPVPIVGLCSGGAWWAVSFTRDEHAIVVAHHVAAGEGTLGHHATAVHRRFDASKGVAVGAKDQ